MEVFPPHKNCAIQISWHTRSLRINSEKPTYVRFSMVFPPPYWRVASPWDILGEYVRTVHYSLSPSLSKHTVAAYQRPAAPWGCVTPLLPLQPANKMLILWGCVDTARGRIKNYYFSPASVRQPWACYTMGMGYRFLGISRWYHGTG